MYKYRLAPGARHYIFTYLCHLLLLVHRLLSPPQCYVPENVSPGGMSMSRNSDSSLGELTRDSDRSEHFMALLSGIRLILKMVEIHVLQSWSVLKGRGSDSDMNRMGGYFVRNRLSARYPYVSQWEPPGSSHWRLLYKCWDGIVNTLLQH